MSDNSRKFLLAERGKYSREEKNALGELVKKYEEEYDNKLRIQQHKLSITNILL